ncbi:hypothetical protein GCM10028801_40020 [Nocardioides maradonensis]
MDYISERESARKLAAIGLSLSAAQHLLRTGVAGQPVMTTAARLYDANRIEELARRPAVSAEECQALFPDGFLVARLPRTRSVDAEAAWPDTIDALRGPWPLGPWQAMTVYCWQRLGRQVPLLLSVSGCVISGALTTDFRRADGDARPRAMCFELAAPGTWLGGVTGRMLGLGRGAPVEIVGR